MKALSPVLAAALALTVAGCAQPDGDAGSDGGEAAAAEPLTVFAAASLNSSFTEIGQRWTAETGQQVQFSFAGSSDLVSQLQAGAPADVFASANEANMDKAGDLVGEPVIFVTNTLVIVTAPGNPLDISGIDDLTSEQVLTVICAPQVPCGDATVQLEERNGIEISAVSEESAVTDVLSKVSTGQADAGIVYRTDAATQPDLGTVEIDGAEDVVNSYPIAPVTASDQPDEARAFIDYVTGPVGTEVLGAAGFGIPGR